MGLRICVFCCLILSSFSGVYAQDEMPGNITVCDKSEVNSFTSVNTQLLKSAKLSPATVDIEITYNNFTPEAKNAFQAAIDVWSRILISRVPIKITANYEAIASSTLATSGSKKVFKNFNSAAFKDVWYPSALANTISGRDLDTKTEDILITVNKNIAWSYKTNGAFEQGKYDMMTVILHEIAHGLGFSTSFKTAGTGDNQVQWGLETVPLIYDYYIQNANKQQLIDNAVFGNPSAELKTITTSNKVFYKISKGIYAQNPPKLYAPTLYRQGGSLSHLDESAYPKGTANSLMSPQIAAAEINQYPGEVVLTILNQIGWPIQGVNGYVVTATEPLVLKYVYEIYPNPSQSILKIKIPEGAIDQNHEILFYDNNGREFEAKFIYSQKDLIEINIEGLNAGSYIMNINKRESIRFIKL